VADRARSKGNGFEIVAREVKNKVNEIGDTTKVVMRFSIDDKKYGVEVSGIEEESVFHNILSDSFYGMAATVMNHFGINDYIYPESFENAIYQRSGYDGKAEIG